MKSISQLRRETDVPVVLADHQGFITYLNERWQVVFGWSPEELIGKTLTTIIPSSLRDAHNLGFSRFLSTGQPTLLNRFVRLKVKAKDGQEVDCEHFIIAEQHQGQWVFGAMIRPLGEQ
ncbi:MAG: PAS domain S-box protein [Acidobacteria bacterium]|nr:PAS domain S-box protein [Acidobacteriota bacterium]